MKPSAKQIAGGLVLAGAPLLTWLVGWEGDERVAYADIVGVPTVCNGHTGPDVKVGDVWTKEQCDAILLKNAEEHGKGILACTKVPLNQNQYDALTSWAFNVGVSAACHSTAVRKLNAGDYTGACNELLRWDKAGGKAVRGLTRRRQAERALCLTPVRPDVQERKVTA